jgi:hypothetical protein
MGAEMREMVDAEQVGRLFAALALALPPLGLLFGWWYGSRLGSRRRGAIYGLLAGLIGPLNWCMWRLYNAITDSVGLDTVRNLVINLVLFVVVGTVIGIGSGLISRRVAIASGRPPAPDKAE